MAKDQWVDIGNKQENRTIDIPRWDKMWQCGDTPRSSCKCRGNVHYGYLEAPDTNKTIKTFEEMRYWKTYTHHSDG
jgi:hypothetical protein